MALPFFLAQLAGQAGLKVVDHFLEERKARKEAELRQKARNQELLTAVVGGALQLGLKMASNAIENRQARAVAARQATVIDTTSSQANAGAATAARQAITADSRALEAPRPASPAPSRPVNPAPPRQPEPRQEPPKLLHTYYAISHVNQILKEHGVHLKERNPPVCFRKEYHYSGIKWNQMFFFDGKGYLENITLLHKWDTGVCARLWQEMLNKDRYRIVSVQDARRQIFSNAFSDEDEWLNVSREVVGSGLKARKLEISFVDSWVISYMLNKSGILARDLNQFLASIPANGRLIAIKIMGKHIFVKFRRNPGFSH